MTMGNQYDAVPVGDSVSLKQALQRRLEIWEQVNGQPTALEFRKIVRHGGACEHSIRRALIYSVSAPQLTVVMLASLFRSMNML